MTPPPNPQHPHYTPDWRSPPDRRGPDWRSPPDWRGPGEVSVYCDCCPHRPKKMAVIQPDAIQIISRRSGKKHIVRIPLASTRRSP